VTATTRCGNMKAADPRKQIYESKLRHNSSQIRLLLIYSSSYSLHIHLSIRRLLTYQQYIINANEMYSHRYHMAKSDRAGMRV
jgi:hypothetical protein